MQLDERVNERLLLGLHRRNQGAEARQLALLPRVERRCRRCAAAAAAAAGKAGWLQQRRLPPRGPAARPAGGLRPVRSPRGEEPPFTLPRRRGAAAGGGRPLRGGGGELSLVQSPRVPPLASLLLEVVGEGGGALARLCCTALRLTPRRLCSL